MQRSTLLIGLFALALTAAFGAWSFAQEPPPPDLPEATWEDEESDFELAADMGMPGQGRGRGMGMMGGHGMMGGPFFAGMAEELALTEEQQSKLRSLHFEGAKSGLQARTNLMLRRLELEELLQQDEPPAAEVEKRIKALTDAQGALTRHRIEHRLAFRRVLTAEQRAKLRSLVRQRMQERRGRRFERHEQRWMQHGPGGPGFRREGEPPPPPPEP